MCNCSVHLTGAVGGVVGIGADVLNCTYLPSLPCLFYCLPSVRQLHGMKCELHEIQVLATLKGCGIRVKYRECEEMTKWGLSICTLDSEGDSSKRIHGAIKRSKEKSPKVSLKKFPEKSPMEFSKISPEKFSRNFWKKLRRDQRRNF